MRINFSSDVPIFIQIAQQLEESVFTGLYKEENQIPSTTEISVNYKINPATVLKGMNILVESGIIYKRRGVGMFVASGAREKIVRKRQEEFTDQFIDSLVNEARKLNLSKNDVIEMIERGFEE